MTQRKPMLKFVATGPLLMLRVSTPAPVPSTQLPP